MARVLMVEDDDRLALSMRVRLEKAGHEVLWAKDGLEALELVAREELGLILLDLSLPKLDGIQVSKRLLGGEEPPPPIVLVTGSRAEDYPEQQEVFEQLDILRKPYTSEELASCLERALG